MRKTLLLIALTIPGWAEPHLGQTLAEWKAQLASQNRVERLVAARSLGEMAIAGQPGAAQAVFESMSHSDSAVRYWAMVAAGQMGEAARPAEKKLTRALEDQAPEVRVWAACALVKLGRADAGVQVLVRELDNPEKGARLQAALAIDELGVKARAAAPALKTALDDEFDYVQRVSRHALWVLGERPCPYRSCQ